MRGGRVDIGGLEMTAGGGGEGEGEKREDFILCCIFLRPTGGIIRPPILLLRGVTWLSEALLKATTMMTAPDLGRNSRMKEGGEGPEKTPILGTLMLS